MRKSLLLALIVLMAITMVATFSLAGCKKETAETTAAETTAAATTMAAETTVAETAAETTAEDMTAIDPKIIEFRQGLDKFRTTNSNFKGPGGQTPTWDTELVLTKAEVAKIQESKHTAALARHGSQGEYTEALYGGCIDYLKYLGFEITADTSAEFDDAKLKSNVETIMATKPDVIIGFPQNTITAAEIFRPVVDAGIKLVFVSNLPDKFVHNKDYVGVSTSQPFDQAIFMADAIGKSGAKNVGFIFYNADFYIVNLIDKTVEDTLKANYPDVKIVSKEGFADPAKIGEVAAAMLQKNPEIDIFYTPFSGLPIASACQDAGRKDIKVVTEGLDVPYTVNMLSDGNIYAIVTDSTYNIGVNMAIMAGYGVLGKEAPDYVITPSATVTKDNIEEMWNFAFRIVPLPDEIKNLLK